MTFGMLYVFVEGPDDRRFFSFILKGKDIQIVEYSNMSQKKIANYIKSIVAIPGCDYIFTADADGATIEQKIVKTKSHYPTCECEKIYIVQREIESWYLAGIKEDKYPSIKKRKILNTDNTSKEEFDSLIPKHYTRVTFMIELLNQYDLYLAKERNTSFMQFVNSVL